MPYKKYNSSNNAFAAFNLPIADTDLTCVLKGKYSRFPTSNFIMKATHTVSGVVTGRENIYVTTRSGATCTGLIRAYEPVPTDDAATTNIQQALNFSADDVVEVVVSSEFLKDMQEDIEKRMYKFEGTLYPSGSAAWTKLGRFSGGASSRMFVEILGGQGFNSNALNGVSVTQAILSMQSDSHIKNLMGYIFKSFGAYHPVIVFRVVRISTYVWDLFIYAQPFSNNTMVSMRWSAGTFTPVFDNTVGPNIDEPNGIYDLTEFTIGIDIASIGIQPTFTNQQDYIPFQMYAGGNAKISFQNLRKQFADNWGLPNTTYFAQQTDGGYGWTTPSNSVVSLGGMVTVSLGGIYSGASATTATIQYSSDNINWTNIAVVNGILGTDMSVSSSVLVKSGYVRCVFNDNGYTYKKSFTVQQFT